MSQSICRYHAVVLYEDKQGKKKICRKTNHTELEIKRELTEPFNNNTSLWLFGALIPKSQVNRLLIFKTDEGIADTNFKVLEANLDSFKGDINGKFKIITNFFYANADEVTSEYILLNNENKEEANEPILTNRVNIFIVHGRDDREALALQKYLRDTHNLNAIIFDDFKRKTTGKTVIEALEEIRDSIGYAFIIAAPEDLGQWREEVNDWCKENLMCYSSVEAQKVNQFINSMLNTRARQNVVFEYGLFIGALGRDRVCCLLKSGTKEKPSDISGVLYEEFKHSISEKFADIAEKLKNPEIGLIK